MDEEYGKIYARLVEQRKEVEQQLLNVGLVYGEIRKEPKKYYFTDDSWWDSPGCSCCEASLMEAYNSDDTYNPLGSAHSIAECYVQAVTTELLLRHPLYEFDADVLYLLEECEIKALCKSMDIEVEVE